MFTKEEVDSWNALFPECQINNTNLSNPTEQFLINALVNYLRGFGYDVNPPFNLNVANKENNRENRLFLIKLARHIDHFLKIIDKGYLFTYYDLIRPTPKKTARMLSILLNYYYYYNLYKEDVFKMASGKQRELQELRHRIDNTHQDNERRKEEYKNLKSTIANLMEDVPNARLTRMELNKQHTQQEEELKKLTNSYQEIKSKLKHLEEQKKLLRKRVVPEEESQELHNQLEQLKLELAKHKEIEFTKTADLNECKEYIAELQNLTEEVIKASEIIPPRLIKQVQEINKQLAHVTKETHKLKLEETKMLQEIDEETIKGHTLEQELQSKKLEHETRKNELIMTITDKEKVLKQKQSEIQLLEEEDHLSDCKLEEQKDTAQYLQENGSEILSAYKD